MEVESVMPTRFVTAAPTSADANIALTAVHTVFEKTQSC